MRFEGSLGPELTTSVPVATQILEDLGYRPTWAANAEEALDRLENGEGFDLVFTDVVMPGMGGVELAKALQRRLPRLLVVLASGYSHVLAQEGTHGFELLHKPYSAVQLGSILNSAPCRADTTLACMPDRDGRRARGGVAIGREDLRSRPMPGIRVNRESRVAGGNRVHRDGL